MLSYFPSSYPDEDFRSTIHRYHVHSGNVEFVQTNRELFNVNSPRNPYIPRNLMYLLSRYPNFEHFSIEQILNSQTLFPLLKPFMKLNSIVNTMSYVQGNNDNSDYTLSRLMGNRFSSIVSKRIRYCPDCLLEDFGKFGECFVHRLHQIEFVDICHEHHCQLIDQCPVCGVELSSKHSDRLLSCPICSNGHSLRRIGEKEIEENPRVNLHLRDLRDCKILMETSVDFSNMSDRFQILLFRKGYVNLQGTLRKHAFALDFESGMSWLNFARLGEKTIDYRRMFNSQWGIQSIPLYMALMRFLAGSVTDFLYGSYSFAVPLPFGVGPWACRNRICPDYQRLTIHNCNRKVVKRGSISGYFECPTCGQAYSSRVSPSEFDSVVNRVKIESKGFMWDQIVFDLYQQGLNIKEVAKRVGMTPSDLKKIRPHLYRAIDGFSVSSVPMNLRIASSEIEAGCTQVATGAIGRKDQYRQLILSAKSRGEALSRSGIRTVYPYAYHWLMKNDREWMESVLPRPNQGKPRHDWDKIDRQLEAKVIVAAESVFQGSEKRQIKPFTIIKKLSQLDASRLSMNRNRLPRAWAALERCMETQDEYLIRIIPLMLKNFEAEGYKSVTPSTFFSKERYKNCSKRVKAAVLEVCTS